MGRAQPKERTTFSLSASVKDRLEDRVPKSERSRYVEAAIDRSLREDARKELLKFLDDLPKAAKGKDSGTEALRRLRLEADGRPVDILEGRRKRSSSMHPSL
jgi:hypothetical protein